MGGVKVFTLNGAQRRARPEGFLDGGRIFRRQTIGENEFAEIVQDAGAKGLLAQERVL